MDEKKPLPIGKGLATTVHVASSTGDFSRLDGVCCEATPLYLERKLSRTLSYAEDIVNLHFSRGMAVRQFQRGLWRVRLVV